MLKVNFNLRRPRGEGGATPTRFPCDCSGAVCNRELKFGMTDTNSRRML